MLFLVFSILSSALIMLNFKFLERYDIKIFNVIVVNYFAASLLGLLLSPTFSPNTYLQAYKNDWFIYAIIIGILFIVMFYVIAVSSQKAGVSVTSVASKMSVIVPMLFSIIFYKEAISILKISGIILALLAVWMSSVKKKKMDVDPRYIYLPFVLFIGAGIIDLLVKFSQEEYVKNASSAGFSGFAFTVSALIGLIISLFKGTSLKKFFHLPVLLGGIFLGACNFGSIYFLINALNTDFLDSSVIFAMNNIGVVSVATIGALLLFKEKLSLLNWAGIITAIFAILLLMQTT